ncbi:MULTISPECIES: arsenate reductase/protein-tyrosine-phosphatase family protein [unclassified Frondihabitans]|uniref:arsenate reductase/protein-tyrosine-phosphatase family protein n=1 Tax=unclassified Frondihabitans TaxID=2626248 RepID=UPI0006F6D0DE|nr:MULTISPECIES: low molecular weight phosphatase family protein [unclassified Frondihabitans]KQQ28376.1 hypothetical protein ASF54_06760 [Frondihabitans sp. Leaf304]RPE78660.1 protein-tyrosine phosphatase [Frondihabitans sp. PhB153]RPF08941.1 protein-tyrosine phosphatase [Frondihabitans sp. PhB161]
MTTALPLSVLVVCTGNICRSPLAEQLLAARLDRSFLLSSAGTFAETSSPMEPLSAELSRQYGGVPELHRARDLDVDMIRAADLILTATREHRAAAVSMLPRASRYTFTLAEFARLAAYAGESGELVASDPRLVVQAAAASRGIAPPPGDPADDDIEDPYGRSRATHERVATRIDDLVSSIVGSFALAGGTGR